MRSTCRPTRAPLSAPGTVAGRAFATSTTLRTPGNPPGQLRLWLLLLDGTERLGVMGTSLDDGALSHPIVTACERFARDPYRDDDDRSRFDGC